MNKKLLYIIGAVFVVLLPAAFAVFMLLGDDDEPGVDEENRSTPTTTISVGDDESAPQTPDPTTTVDGRADAVAGDPMVVGDGPVTVEIFADPLCPGCSRLATEHGREIDEAVAAGQITVRYHLLDLGLRDDDYSERANAAIRCAADAEPEMASRMAGTILGMAPGREGNLTNEEFVGISRSLVGLPEDSERCILEGERIEQAREASEASRDRLAALGGRGVPTVVIDGEMVDVSDPNWLTAAL